MGNSCTGRVALVTGASQGGTGTALAVRLAAEGARVAITARSSEGLATTKKRIEARGGEVLSLSCDLGDPSGGRDDLVAKTEDHFGAPIDILVNNAAAGGFKPFEHFTHEELVLMSEVNVFAPWKLMSQVIGPMRERGEGWILNLTSFVGEWPQGPPFPNTPPAKLGSAYGSTKAMLNRFTLSAAAECEGQGVAVNALAPQAVISTPALIELNMMDPDFYEPMEATSEAGLVLCTCDPAKLHGRIAFTIQLLMELERPVYDLHGEELFGGWQPADLRRHLETQLAAHERTGLRNAYAYDRPSSPCP